LATIEEQIKMQTYRIHPIVMGTKVFDKSMMTCQHDYGTPYTIPSTVGTLQAGTRPFWWTPVR